MKISTENFDETSLKVTHLVSFELKPGEIIISKQFLTLGTQCHASSHPRDSEEAD